MKTNKNYGQGVTSIDIIDVNMLEVRQMNELKNKINDVLVNHKEKKEKKIYLSDDDLTLMYAILRTFTKDVDSSMTSSFDETLKEMEKAYEQHKLDEADDYASREC